MLQNLDEVIQGCKHFKWREALWLNSLGVCVFPQSEVIIQNIIKTASKLEDIRDLLGQRPIQVTSWYRPSAYNKMIGGAERSSHMVGLAVDFKVNKMISENVRLALKPNLQLLNVRMEALNTIHVHIDLNCDEKMPNEKRFFLP